MGDRISVDPFTLFGKPLDITCAIGNFTPGFCQGLTLFGGQNLRQVLLIFHHQVEPLTQYGRPCP